MLDGPTTQRGLTLLEVLVAMVVVAIGLVAILQALGACLQAEIRAQERQTASMLAAEKLSEILKEPSIAVGRESGEFGEDFPEHDWEAEISETEVPGLDLVTVTVRYRVGRKQRTYELSALKREEQTQEEAGMGGGVL